MGEILNRLLLIAYSCIILVVACSIIIPFIENNNGPLSQILNKSDQIEDIDINLTLLEQNVINFKNSKSNSYQRYEFTTHFNFTGFVLINYSNQIVIRFIFYLEKYSSPVFRDISFDFYIIIDFRAFILRYYYLTFQNNSICLSLY